MPAVEGATKQFGVGRCIIGALLNAAYEANGAVNGRILFLLDEAFRLGRMDIIEIARDAGRKYGISLQLLYQSVGQIVEQWGEAGKRAWYESASWRGYAAWFKDPETGRKSYRKQSAMTACSPGRKRRTPEPMAGSSTCVLDRGVET